VQQIIYNRLNRNVIIDETRAYRDKNKILVKLNLISDKLDLLYQSKNDLDCTIIDHVLNKKDNAYEVPYNQFCKYALGVSKFASTSGTLSELNRCPISIKAMVQSINFWHRLETVQSGTILENSYFECKRSKHAFYQNVEYLLIKNGLGNIMYAPHNYRSKQVASIVKQNLTDQHRQLIHNTILNDDKFCTLKMCNLSNVHNTNIIDPYHKTIKNPHIRKCFARLRLDKANNFNTANDKKCDLCDVPINSTHLLIECTKTVTERECFFSKMYLVFPSFKKMTQFNKCNIILNLAHKNDKVLNDICSYVKLICQKHCIV